MPAQEAGIDMINQIEPNIDGYEVEAMNNYLQSGAWLTEYDRTTEFECKIAEYVGSKYCVVVPSGTVALAVALWACGIGYGDEVLVPNYTMIATPNAVRMVGATPVLVDIEAKSLCMDLDCVWSLSEKTRAIINVSLNGRALDMARFQDFCTANNLTLIEDACQSLGSFHNGRHLGTFGDIGVFSFSSPKIVTTGQGGALVTDDEGLYDKIRKLKDWGRDGSDIHNTLGYNFKFTDLQAVIGIEQMKKLPWASGRKRHIYQVYESQLSDVFEMIHGSNESTPWFVDIYLDNPTVVQEHLKENGVGSRLVYKPINEQKIYADGKSYPVSKRFSHRGLWLPSSVNLTDEQIINICGLVKQKGLNDG